MINTKWYSIFKFSYCCSHYASYKHIYNLVQKEFKFKHTKILHGWVKFISVCNSVVTTLLLNMFVIYHRGYNTGERRSGKQHLTDCDYWSPERTITEARFRVLALHFRRWRVMCPSSTNSCVLYLIRVLDSKKLYIEFIHSFEHDNDL